MKYARIVIFVFSLLTPAFSHAQGCSDAGFCTINSFKPTLNTSAKDDQIRAGISFGSADNNITTSGGFIEYSRALNDRFSVDGKLTALGQRGNGLSAFNVSDIYLNANYAIYNSLRFTAGVKLPLNNANRKQDGLSLPMDYQSSLGTLDMIAGLSYVVRKLQLVAALQLPLTQNGNQFLAQEYAGSALEQFQSTNKFKRSGDVLLRVSYPFQLGSKFRVTPSLLPIYHFREDKYTDASGQEQSITGSSGLTLNGNAYVDYAISEVHSLQLSAGMPFITRKSRPDGLTRHFIIGMTYGFSF